MTVAAFSTAKPRFACAARTRAGATRAMSKKSVGASLMAGVAAVSLMAGPALAGPFESNPLDKAKDAAGDVAGKAKDAAPSGGLPGSGSSGPGKPKGLQGEKLFPDDAKELVESAKKSPNT